MRVAGPGDLRRHGDRVHVHLGGRHVSLINHHGDVYCIDSLCYHAGGRGASTDAFAFRFLWALMKLASTPHCLSAT